MEKKDFVFILPSLGAGGGNRVIISLANMLTTLEYGVTLYVYSSEKECRYPILDAVRVKQYKDINPNKFTRIYSLFKILRQIKKHHKEDVIVVTDQFSVILAFLIRKQTVFRYVQADDYNFYDDLQILKHGWILKLYKKMIKHSFKYKFLHNIYVSEFIYNQCAKFVNKKEHYNKLNPPVNRQAFYNNSTRTFDECNICIVARNHPTKGFSDFTEAFSHLRDKDRVSHVFVLTPDDLQKYNLCGMDKIMPHNDEEMNLYYNKSHIFISTTWNEGFGLPALEAMSAGCACIICNNGGTAEYAVDGDNCLLYEAHDWKMLEDKLSTLIEDESLRVKLSHSAEETSKRFDNQVFVRRFLEIVDSELSTEGKK